MKAWIAYGITLVLAVSCATYDPAAEYRGLLTPFSPSGEGPRLTAADFAVPAAFVPPELPTPLANSKVGSVIARVESLLMWMGDRVVFDGGSMPGFPLTAATLWSASRAGASLNCLAASTLFASLAQGQGLSARVLWLYSRDLSNENHVIVLVWDGEARWLAVDPSYRTLFYGDSRPLGPEELRSRVAVGAPVAFSSGASWNGETLDEGYLHYLSKNLYRWSALGASGGRINLSPSSFGGWGPPWALSTTVRDAREFLTPP